MRKISPDIYNEEYFKGMRGDRLLYKKFISLASELPFDTGKILDVGFGRGELLINLLQQGASHVYGVDFSKTAVTETKREITKLKLKYDDNNLSHAFIEDISLYPKNFFDVIFMMDVVEHLPQNILHSGLTNINKWLKPTGRLIIHTYPTKGPNLIYHFLLKLQGKKKLLTQNKELHCNVQTRKSLMKSIQKAGLQCEKMWLENDFLLTSQYFHQLKEGIYKNSFKFIFN